MEELKDNFYMLLNVAVGGNLTGNVPPSTAYLPATMEVDYVRWYRDKTAEELAAEKAEEENKKATAVTTAAAKKVTKPKKVKITRAKNIKKRKISLKYKKVKGAKGYQIRWCDNKKFRGYLQKRTTKTSYTLKKLRKKKTYSIKVRAYKLSGKRKVYGAWSKVKRVKIRK